MNQLQSLNANIPVQNVDATWIYTEENDIVLIIYPLRNITTDDSPIRVYFWFNASYYSNITSVQLFYYNETHSNPELAVNKTHPNEYPDSWWWTENIWLPIESYYNRSRYDIFPINIPRQKANTTVEFRIVLRIDNGISNLWWGGNFTVRYSQQDQLEFESTHRTYWQVFGGVLLLVPFYFGLLSYIISPTNKDELIKKGNTLKKPSTRNRITRRDFINRADVLETRTNELRTASSLLLGLTVAYYYFIKSSSFSYLAFGLLLLIFCTLGSIVISFRGTRRDTLGIDDSLLPLENSQIDYDDALRVVISSRVEKISLMRSMLHFGVYIVIVGFVADAILPNVLPLVGLLTDGQFTDLWTIGLGTVYTPVVGIFVLLIVLAVLRIFGLSEWYSSIRGE